MRVLIVMVIASSLIACQRHAATASPGPNLPAINATTIALPKTSGNIWLPRSALVQRGGITGAFVAQDGVARFRMLRIGAQRANEVEVIAGLNGDERLLIGDLTAVHDGSLLQGTRHGR